MASTERLHALLQVTLAERDRFAAHLYQSRREYRRASDTAGKSGKRIERCISPTRAELDSTAAGCVKFEDAHQAHLDCRLERFLAGKLCELLHSQTAPIPQESALHPPGQGGLVPRVWKQHCPKSRIQ
jgi:hypothetical protein